MSWRSTVPEGLLDAFREAAFTSPDGVIVVLLDSQHYTLRTFEGDAWGRLMLRLYDLVREEKKCDVYLYLGRMDKEGNKIPPTIQVRELL